MIIVINPHKLKQEKKTFKTFNNLIFKGNNKNNKMNKMISIMLSA